PIFKNIEYDEKSDTAFVDAVLHAAADNPNAEEIIYSTSDVADAIRFMINANTSSAYNGKNVFLNISGAAGQVLNTLPKPPPDGIGSDITKWWGDISPTSG